MSTPKFPGSKKTFEQVVIGDPSNSASTPELIVNGTSVFNDGVTFNNDFESTQDAKFDSSVIIDAALTVELDGGGMIAAFGDTDTAEYVAIGHTDDLPVAGTANVTIATDTGNIVTKGTITATTATTSLAVEDLAVDADGSDATAVDVGGGNLTIDGTTGDLSTAGGITVTGTADITGNVSVGDATTTAGIINVDGATSAADIVITGGGITGATGVSMWRHDAGRLPLATPRLRLPCNWDGAASATDVITAAAASSSQRAARILPDHPRHNRAGTRRRLLAACSW